MITSKDRSVTVIVPDPAVPADRDTVATLGNSRCGEDATPADR